MKNKFYTSEQSVREQQSRWIGRAKILRSDTLETVEEITVFGDQKEIVESDLQNKLSSWFAISEEPSDWENRDKVELLLYRFDERQEQEAAFFFGEKLQKLTGIDEYAQMLNELSNCVRKNTVELSSEIESLTEDEKIRLVSASEEECAKYNSGDSLQTIFLKKKIYQYIINPSEQISNAHKKLCDMTS